MQEFPATRTTAPSAQQSRPFQTLQPYQERTTGKRAILVLDRAESHPDLVDLAGMHLPTADLRAMSLSDFVTVFAKMEADLIFIHNPRNLVFYMPELMRCMPEFRANNPKSVVLMTYAHLQDSVIRGGIEKLLAMKCLDHVEPDSVLFGQFLRNGAELFVRRHELQ